MVQMLVEMRFAFFGKSGWQSNVAADPDLLFAPERLEKRFALLEAIPLASLQAQTDQDFRLVVLSSELMPKNFQDRLVETCNRILGEERVEVIFREEGHAGTLLRKYVHSVYDKNEYVAQIVLDDDDGLSSDFIEICRKECELAKANFLDGTEEMYLSFPKGCSLILREGETQLAERKIPYTNLGLTFLSKARSKANPYSVAHRKISGRYESRVIGTLRPFYLRAVHDNNDSKAIVKQDPMTKAEVDAIKPYFPYLDGILGQ